MKAELGKRYIDKITQFEGTCTGIFEYMHGCRRIQIDGVKVDAQGNPEPIGYTFDEPQLTDSETGQELHTTRPGGPKDAPQPRNGPR